MMSKNLQKLFILIASLLLLSVCYGEENEFAKTVEISPFGGYSLPSNGEDIKGNFMYGLRVGYNWNDFFGTELEGSFLGTQYEDMDVDLDITSMRLNMLFSASTDNMRWVPYFKLGAGNVEADPETGISESEFAFNSGFGVRYFFPDSRWGFRAEVQGYLGDEINGIEATAGLTFLIGKRAVRDADGDGVIDKMDKCPATPSGATVDSDGCPKDSDSDGVFDGLDKCPDTPMGAVIDETGCPKDSDNDGVYDGLDKCPDTLKGAIVDETGCPKDSDNDGVYDGLDKCPDTPKGAIIDETGCPKDSDGDGVYDGFDECPDTAPGVKVNEKGCEEIIKVGEVVVLEDLYFDTNMSNIDEKDAQILDEWFAMLMENPGVNILVSGHTDSQGSEAYNQQLSEKRAAAVKDYLIAKGIDASRIEAKGFGESQPRESNDTPEGMAKNRRVEIKRTK